MIKALKKEPKKLFSIRIKKEDIVLLKDKAKRYAGGNVSDWIIYASKNYTPKKCELDK